MRPSNSFLNGPLINTVTGYIGRLQQQKVFTRESLNISRHYLLLTIGFFILLYCLLHIQILIFWLIKLIYSSLITILCFPLKTLGFFIPKTVNYELVFPLFWLCSIVSFYVSKTIHEKICQYFDEYFVRRYRLFHFQPSKRDEIRRNLFLSTFIVLLLLQTFLFLLPIGQSTKYHKTESPSIGFSLPSMKTYGEQFYKSFLHAFEDEKNLKLDDDHQVEVTLKTIESEIKTLAEQKRSRFQRWFSDPLKSLFINDNDWSQFTRQSTENPIDGQREEEEEGQRSHVSSSSMIDEDEDQDDDDDDDNDQHTTIETSLSSTIQPTTEEEQNQISSSSDQTATISDKFQQLKERIENFSEQMKFRKKSVIENKKKTARHPLAKRKSSQDRKANRKRSKGKHRKLNGWLEEPWNVWDLNKKKLSQIYRSSSKNGRHAIRFNTTSVYTAFTDVRCLDYTKMRHPYRSGKMPHRIFLNLYRQHSPFPVYLSVLKSNGPLSYRFYPDSSCGIKEKRNERNVLKQIFRFLRFWFIIGSLVSFCAWIYQRRTSSKRINDNDIDQGIGERKFSLNKQVEGEFRRWFEREQNHGFQQLSQTVRAAINQTFHERTENLRVETLQFANASIRDVLQSTDGNTTLENLTIFAVLELDHLILNFVNRLEKQHFSFESQQLIGDLLVKLFIQQNQYSLEVHFRQARLSSVKIIDPNEILPNNQKRSLIELIESIVEKSVVNCSFCLTDREEILSKPVETKENKKTSPDHSISIQSCSLSATSSPRPVTPTNYKPFEPTTTLLTENASPYSYPVEPELKRMIVRVVKAVNLHNIENPYCILELNQPKQIFQTSIAKNSVNPFWDERFSFECAKTNDQIHLQIINRKLTSTSSSQHFVDTVYADLLIPFAYAMNTVDKRDIQISPLQPESIIRLEFSTLSEQEALAANNGFDVESISDSQNWIYNEQDQNIMEPDFGQNYEGNFSNFNQNALTKDFQLKSQIYDRRDYVPPPSTVPTHPSILIHSAAGSPVPEKAQKSKSFMSSLKHLTLPRSKSRNKDKHHNDDSMSSQASSFSQLNIFPTTPATNLAAQSLSSALPGPNAEYFPSGNTEEAPIRRSRSISQSFRNLFRSSSKKKSSASKKDAAENRNYLSTSTPTPKKLSFLQRRKSKQKAKQQTHLSTNSLSSYDHSRGEYSRDTPVRANVGHPVIMSKSLVR